MVGRVSDPDGADPDLTIKNKLDKNSPTKKINIKVNIVLDIDNQLTIP